MALSTGSVSAVLNSATPAMVLASARIASTNMDWIKPENASNAKRKMGASPATGRLRSAPDAWTGSHWPPTAHASVATTCFASNVAGIPPRNARNAPEGPPAVTTAVALAWIPLEPVQPAWF